MKRKLRIIVASPTRHTFESFMYRMLKGQDFSYRIGGNFETAEADYTYDSGRARMRAYEFDKCWIDEAQSMKFSDLSECAKMRLKQEPCLSTKPGGRQH